MFHSCFVAGCSGLRCEGHYVLICGNIWRRIDAPAQLARRPVRERVAEGITEAAREAACAGLARAVIRAFRNVIPCAFPVPVVQRITDLWQFDILW